MRSVFVGQAPGLPHRARSSVPLHGDLACADAVLHRRGGVARARSRPRRRCTSKLSRPCRRPGATTRWRRSGGSCATCAASSPARSNSSGRPSASAPRSKPRRSSMSPTRSFSARGRCRSCRVVHHLGRDPGRRRRTAIGVPARRRARRRGRAPAAPKAANAPVRGRSHRPSGVDPQYPDVTPRDAQALREWDAMRKAAE